MQNEQATAIHIRDQKDEQPKAAKPAGRRKLGIRSYLTTPIRTEHADIPLIVCCFITGLVDASMFNAYSSFTAMQTGNTVILALGPSHNNPENWPKSLTSIAVFAVSCFIYHRGLITFGQLHRLTLFISFVIQTIFIVVSAALIQTDSVPKSSPMGLSPKHLELIPIALLSSQFGGQMMTSRLCGMSEVPTTVLTSVYCDLAIDLDNSAFAPKTKRDGLRRKKWRRIGAVLGVILGGISGGFIAKSRAGTAGSLWVAAGLKFSVACGWLLMKSQEPPDEKSPQSKSPEGTRLSS